jgi:acetylornithine deacetylase
LNVFELTKKLVSIPSVTGNETQIADYLCDYLKGEDFVVKEQTVEAGRRNVLAIAGVPPKVILCTHLDTVPPHFPASEDEHYIFGRGACDAKGIMASMILAARNLKKQGITGIGLLFVVGEETNSIGAKMANSLNVGSEFIIVGEPTENKLGKGHKGLVALKIVARGKTAHSAFPHLGESAIEKLLDALQKLRALDFAEDELFGKSFVNIGTIEGGVAHNVIAEHAQAEVSVRSALNTNKIIAKIKEAVNKKVEIETLTQSEPQRLFTVSDFEHIVLPFCTDIPHLKNFGRPLLIGPGSPLVAHTENEKIAKRQLTEAIEIYQKLAKKLLTINSEKHRDAPSFTQED